MSEEGAAAAMEATKRRMNQGSECWYMGSPAAMSEMQKKRTLTYALHG
jgi:hypothetical protein